MSKTFKRLSLMLMLTLVLTFSFGAIALAGPDEIWDGSIDVSWYNENDSEFYIDTPAKLAGVAAIVNGIVPDNTNIIGDAELTKGTYETDHWVGKDDFKNKTIYLTKNLDMGGPRGGYVDGEAFSGPNYMPIGGQYLMKLDDNTTMVGGSFNGTFDGQNNVVYNIFCERKVSNYKGGQSVALIGRLGNHDSDPGSIWADSPTVKNVVVDGYISTNRSVGGIVGKTGQSKGTIIIENCVNMATVKGSDSKGTGGIAGAAWNKVAIKNCYNMGKITNTGSFLAGGISGSNEAAVTNCYNVGKVSSGKSSMAMSLGTENGGSSSFDNCYYLEGTASGGGIYKGGQAINSGAKDDVFFASEEFLNLLNEVNNNFVLGQDGFPVPASHPETSHNDTDPIVKATSTIVAPDKIFVNENRELSYVVSLGNVKNANVFEVSANFDQDKLDYVGYEFLKTDRTPSLTAIGEPYDAATGKFNLKFIVNTKGGSGEYYNSIENTPIVKINFKVKDNVALGTSTSALLDEFEVTVVNGEKSATGKAVIKEKSVNTEISDSILIYDINNDGEFNKSDISLILAKYYLHASNDATWDQAKLYDVNKDGKIDIVDITAFFSFLK